MSLLLCSLDAVYSCDLQLPLTFCCAALQCCACSRLSGIYGRAQRVQSLRSRHVGLCLPSTHLVLLVTNEAALGRPLRPLAEGNQCLCSFEAPIWVISASGYWVNMPGTPTNVRVQPGGPQDIG